MGPEFYFNTVFSGLSIAFMEDLGYYKGIRSMEEKLHWGLGKGCSLFLDECSSRPYSCTENQKTCSPDYKSMGTCKRDPFQDDCSTFAFESGQSCLVSNNKASLLSEGGIKGVQRMEFGVNSRCVEGIIDDA